MRARGQRGFTLIEMIVVLLVLAMIAGMASARLSVRSGAESLQAIAYEIASRCRAARASAVRGGADQVVLIDLADRVMTGGGKEPIQIPQTISIVAETSAAERPSASVAAVRFMPNGSSTGGMVRLQSGGQAYEIRINWFTGRVSVETTP
jgi:general secretion pathway protein H